MCEDVSSLLTALLLLKFYSHLGLKLGIAENSSCTKASSPLHDRLQLKSAFFKSF